MTALTIVGEPRGTVGLIDLIYRRHAVVDSLMGGIDAEELRSGHGTGAAAC